MVMMRTMLVLAALVALAAGVFVDPPAARAIDNTYFSWCQQAVGDDDYCCNKAGGVWDGSHCGDTAPSPTATYLPPNSGFFVP